MGLLHMKEFANVHAMMPTVILCKIHFDGRVG